MVPCVKKFEATMFKKERMLAEAEIFRNQPGTTRYISISVRLKVMNWNGGGLGCVGSIICILNK